MTRRAWRLPTGARDLLPVALACASVAGAAALTWAVRLFAADTLFIFFIAAVALTARNAGTGMGLLATVLSALVVDYAFVPPFGSFFPSRAADVVRLASFVAVAALLAVLSGALRGSRDRAERLRAEADRARAMAEAARAAADQASAAKGEFLATMSHELRTPINAVLGYADLLELGAAGPVSEIQVAYLGRLRTAGRHLLALVNDVLDLAKTDAGRLTVSVGRARLADAADDARALTLPQALAKGVDLRGRTGADGGSRTEGDDSAADDSAADDDDYLGDPERVRQIVVNLLANAVKFTPAGGTVTLTWGADARPAERAWIRVADTGVGIADADHERVFEPFEQVDGSATRAAGGTGLGLAISRRLARLMAGDLTVESAPGRGSTFTLWLPAARPESERGRHAGT